MPMLAPGNIDLNNRPHVRNSDGSISTVRSMGVNIDGHEYLLPTVSEDGRIMSNHEAIEQFKKTGKHLGIFSDVASSNKYAKSLHEDQAKLIEPQGDNMDPMTMGLLAGAGKSLLVDIPKERRQRVLAAQTAMYSPWTGMAPQPVQEADMFGSLLQGGTAGAMYNQQQQQNDMAQQDLNIKKDYYGSLKGAPAAPALGSSANVIPAQSQGPSLMSPEMQDFMKKKNSNQGYMYANY